MSQGVLYYFSGWKRKVTGSVGIELYEPSGYSNSIFYSATTSWVQVSLYLTALTNNGVYTHGYVETSGEGRFDDFSLQQVTDIPATGVRLHSLHNGTDRKVILVGSGNQNAISQYRLYYIGS
jgi:hypothetical protein